MRTLSTFLQQTPSIPDSPSGWIVSGGIAGVLCFVIVAFLREWIYVGSVARARLKEKDEEIAELKSDRAEMTAFLREQVMPALTRSNDFASTLAEMKALEERERLLRSRTERQSPRSSGTPDS